MWFTFARTASPGSGLLAAPAVAPATASTATTTAAADRPPLIAPSSYSRLVPRTYPRAPIPIKGVSGRSHTGRRDGPTRAFVSIAASRYRAGERVWIKTKNRGRRREGPPPPRPYLGSDATGLPLAAAGGVVAVGASFLDRPVHLVDHVLGLVALGAFPPGR